MLRIEKKKDKYQVILTRDEMLTLVNGLAARQLLITDITRLISHTTRDRDDNLTKIRAAMAEALPADVWEAAGGKPAKTAKTKTAKNKNLEE